MNNAILIQQVYSGSPYSNLLRLSFSRHCDYAMRHKMDMQIVMSDVDPSFDQMRGSWAKIALIRNALEGGYPSVFWVDADALIVDRDTDLRTVFDEMGDSLIGACQHPGPPIHLNVGVMFYKNSPRTIDFVRAWLAQANEPNGRWMEQGVFNQMRESPDWADVVCRVGDKWNATYYAGTDCDNPIIRGYHGAASITPVMRFQAMRADLAKVK